jgi:subfamily B ATP-binding cassette protein MsbA
VLAGIIMVTMLRSLFLYWQTVETNRIVMRMTTDMQKVAFEHLVWSDLARLTRETPGRLVSKLTNDISFVQQAALAALNTAVRDVLSVLALAISMFYLDWVMSLIVLGVYPIAAIPVAALSKRLRRVAKRTQDELGDMTSLLTEKLSSARLIKSFRLEKYAGERLNQSFEQVYDLRMKAVRNRARIDPMLEALGGLAVTGVIAFAYWRIASGISTVGDFMGFITALLMAAQPIRALGALSGRINEGLAAAESFYGLIDEAPLIVDAPGAKPLTVTSSTIRFDDVAFAYDKQKGMHAIRHFSLVVPGGKTVALVGRSGAGKSTVLNLVPRLFDVTEGSITIDNQDVRGVTLASLRDAISIVAQDVTLFDDTIGANIALGRLGASKAAIIEAAKAAAAHEFIMEQPDGYATQIGDRGLRLSGGQRQRLALARAILKDAPILLLDEATSALDSESERLVQAALAKFTKNRTTLVIAHRLSTVQNADLICVMEQGTIVETGTHRGLLAEGGTYARLVRSQALSDEGVAQAT